MFDFDSLVNHVGEPELDPPIIPVNPEKNTGRPPRATSKMELYDLDNEGNASNIK